MKTLMLIMTLLLTSGAGFCTDLDQLITKAETSRQKAAKAGFEWTATAGLIKQAKQAKQQGKKAQAKILAHKALKQAQNSLLQAKFAAQHWQDFEPHP
ncbi:MAG: hypothetical protein ACI8WB_003347 [Phenylobacterium sp.]|jgi:hypothetical protein